MALIPPEAAHAALLTLRVGLGAATWVLPKTMARLFAIDLQQNPSLPFVARMYGVRNLALVSGLRERDADERDRLLVLNVAVDLADALSAALAGRRGSLPPAAARRAGVVALAAAGLGMAARDW